MNKRRQYLTNIQQSPAHAAFSGMQSTKATTNNPQNHTSINFNQLDEKEQQQHLAQRQYLSYNNNNEQNKSNGFVIKCINKPVNTTNRINSYSRNQDTLKYNNDLLSVTDQLSYSNNNNFLMPSSYTTQNPFHQTKSNQISNFQVTSRNNMGSKKYNSQQQAQQQISSSLPRSFIDQTNTLYQQVKQSKNQTQVGNQNIIQVSYSNKEQNKTMNIIKIQDYENTNNSLQDSPVITNKRKNIQDINQRNFEGNYSIKQGEIDEIVLNTSKNPNQFNVYLQSAKAQQINTKFISSSQLKLFRNKLINHKNKFIMNQTQYNSTSIDNQSERNSFDKQNDRQIPKILNKKHYRQEILSLREDMSNTGSKLNNFHNIQEQQQFSQNSFHFENKSCITNQKEGIKITYGAIPDIKNIEKLLETQQKSDNQSITRNTLKDKNSISILKNNLGNNRQNKTLFQLKSSLDSANFKDNNMSFSIGSNTAVNKDVGSGLWTQNSMNKYDQCQQIYDQEVKQRQHFILQLRAKRYASNPRNTLQTTTAQQTKYNNKTQNSLKTSNNYNNMYNLKFKDWVSNSTNSNKLNASYIGNSAEVTVEDQQSKRYFPKIQGTNSQFEAEGFEILELQKETDQNFQEQQNLHNTTQKKYSYFMEHQHKNKDNQHSRQSTNTYQQRVNQTKTMLSNINKRLKSNHTQTSKIHKHSIEKMSSTQIDYKTSSKGNHLALENDQVLDGDIYDNETFEL